VAASVDPDDFILLVMMRIPTTLVTPITATIQYNADGLRSDYLQVHAANLQSAAYANFGGNGLPMSS
jgi:hypothetical protein